jgi:hypothetical protein
MVYIIYKCSGWAWRAKRQQAMMAGGRAGEGGGVEYE